MEEPSEEYVAFNSQTTRMGTDRDWTHVQRADLDPMQKNRPKK
jgi:hypothetical protein